MVMIRTEGRGPHCCGRLYQDDRHIGRIYISPGEDLGRVVARILNHVGFESLDCGHELRILRRAHEERHWTVVEAGEVLFTRFSDVFSQNEMDLSITTTGDSTCFGCGSLRDYRSLSNSLHIPGR